MEAITGTMPQASYGGNKMKKTIIGIAAAVALIPSPASAGYAATTDSIWDVVNITDGTAEQLVLGGGYASALDQCGNGKPSYTVFMPVNEAWDLLLDEENITVPQLISQPNVVKNLLDDHIVPGSFSPDELANPSVTLMISRSGFRIVKNLLGDALYVSGNQIVGSQQACNGWVYYINGVIDSTPQVPTTGVNVAPAPAPAETAPAESSELPNTL